MGPRIDASLDCSVDTVFQLYQLPTSRRLTSMREIRTRALARGWQSVLPLVERSISFDESLHQQENAKTEQSNREMGNGQMSGMQESADEAISALHSGFEGVQKALPKTDSQRERLQTLRNQIQVGPTELSLHPYRRKLKELERIEALLQPEARWLRSLGLSLHLDRFYRALVDCKQTVARREHGLSFKALQQLRAEAHRRGLAVVAWAVATFPETEGEDAANRAYLLEPLLVQNQAVRRTLRGWASTPAA